MKIVFLIAILFAFVHSNGQNTMYPVADYSKIKEINFTSVEKSKLELSESELSNFEIIDTIVKPYSLVIISSTTIYIAIKNENKYNTYPLLIRNTDKLQTKTIKDTLKQTSQDDATVDKIKREMFKFSHPTEVCVSRVYAGSAQRIRLDKFKNSELVLKFFHNSYCCPTCAIPLYPQNYEGYVFFDFDKLQVLEITTLSSIKHVSNGIEIENVPIEFKKKCLKIGKRKYYYRNDKLIRK